MEATFEKDANFGRGGDKEDDETWYEGTRFQDRASFARARFGGAITMTRDTVMKNGLSFEHANFDGAANFMGARFEGDVDFSHAVFARHAQFYLASFDGITTFRDAEFNNSANFFEIVHLGFVDFCRASFAEDPRWDPETQGPVARVNWEDVTLPED